MRSAGRRLHGRFENVIGHLGWFRRIQNLSRLGRLGSGPMSDHHVLAGFYRWPRTRRCCFLVSQCYRGLRRERSNPADHGDDHDDLHGGGDCRRTAFRTLLRPPRTPPRDGDRGGVRIPAGPRVGHVFNRSAHSARGVHDAVHGARRVGCDPRSLERAFARRAARLLPGLCLPNRRALRRQHHAV